MERPRAPARWRTRKAMALAVVVGVLLGALFYAVATFGGASFAWIVVFAGVLVASTALGFMADHAVRVGLAHVAAVALTAVIARLVFFDANGEWRESALQLAIFLAILTPAALVGSLVGALL